MLTSFDESYYCLASDKMPIHPSSMRNDAEDLALLFADLTTVRLLNERNIGKSLTAFGITHNEQQVLIIVTRYAYCCSCGRFSSPMFDAVKNEIMECGRDLCPRFFDSSIEEAVRFARNESEFMNEQLVW